MRDAGSFSVIKEPIPFINNNVYHPGIQASFNFVFFAAYLIKPPN
jgi:hypothetical protein